MVKKSLKKQADIVEKHLHNKGFKHLFVLIRTNNIVIYSKDGSNIENRARLTFIQDSTFQLSMADHTGRWEMTPFQGDLDELLKTITEDFSFALIDFDNFM